MSEYVPAAFAAQVVGFPAAGYVDGDTWIAGLPRLLRDLLDEWALTVTGQAHWGYTALVLPVAGPDGAAVLKLSFPSLESDTEHLALRLWDGHGAVRLLRADPHRQALLLEPLPGPDLSGVEIDEACGIVGDLLRLLAVRATPPFHRLSDRCAVMAEALDTSREAVPRRFVDQARSLLRDLSRAPDLDDLVIHTDLHYANVLAGTRLPWLAIDPKPLAGEQAYEVAPLLWNRPAELGTGTSVRWLLRRRLEIVCDHAGLDEQRARAWAIVRSVGYAMWTDSPDTVSLMVAICKAMND